MTDLTYRSPSTEVRPSPIQGKALFATCAIAKGEIVAAKGGHVLTKPAWTALERDLGPADIQVSDDLFIAPVTQAQRDGSMLYTNHSCDPNLAIQGQIVLVAMRDIVPGDELTIDWATTDGGDYEMQCRCGSAHCRGTVTGKDWMKKELQEKYQGWLLVPPAEDRRGAYRMSRYLSAGALRVRAELPASGKATPTTYPPP